METTLRLSVPTAAKCNAIVAIHVASMGKSATIWISSAISIHVGKIVTGVNSFSSPMTRRGPANFNIWMAAHRKPEKAAPKIIIAYGEHVHELDNNAGWTHRSKEAKEDGLHCDERFDETIKDHEDIKGCVYWYWGAASVGTGSRRSAACFDSLARV
jgi:hypothetical protein